MSYTLYIYKADRRCKTGERLFSTTVWNVADDNGMRRTVAELFDLYPPSKGWRFDWTPSMQTVKSLMTGADVTDGVEGKVFVKYDPTVGKVFATLA